LDADVGQSSRPIYSEDLEQVWLVAGGELRAKLALARNGFLAKRAIAANDKAEEFELCIPDGLHAGEVSVADPEHFSFRARKLDPTPAPKRIPGSFSRPPGARP